MDWEDIVVLDQPIEGDALATVVKTAENLGTRLYESPALAEDIKAVFAQRLGGSIDGTTESELLGSLQVMLGQDVGIFLIWSLRGLDADGVLPTALDQPELSLVTSLLKSLYGLYGIEIQSALVRANQLANDWSNVNLQLLYDVNGAMYRLHLSIGKYSGDNLFLEVTQRSLLDLATVFIGILKDVNAANEIDAATAERFLKSSAELANLLKLNDDSDLTQPGEQQSTH